MTPVGPGHIEATLYIRSHIAVVDVHYTTRSYSIRYKDRTDLNYDGDSIHLFLEESMTFWPLSPDAGVALVYA